MLITRLSLAAIASTAAFAGASVPTISAAHGATPGSGICLSAEMMKELGVKDTGACKVSATPSGLLIPAKRELEIGHCQIKGAKIEFTDVRASKPMIAGEYKVNCREGDQRINSVTFKTSTDLSQFSSMTFDTRTKVFDYRR